MGRFESSLNAAYYGDCHVLNKDHAWLQVKHFTHDLQPPCKAMIAPTLQGRKPKLRALEGFARGRVAGNPLTWRLHPEAPLGRGRKAQAVI